MTARRAALACLGLVALLWAASFHWAAARRVDAQVLDGFLAVWGPGVARGVDVLLALAGLPVFAAALVVLGTVAFRRAGLPLAARVAAAMVVSVVVVQVLQELLAGPRPTGVLPGYAVPEASFPSGHAAAAMAIALGALQALPPQQSTGVAVGGGLYAAGVSLAALLNSGHLPSDVLAGLLLSAAVALVVAAPAPSPAPRGLGRALAVAAPAATVVAVLAVGPGELADVAVDHPVAAVGAAVVAGTAIALPATVAWLRARQIV